MKVASGEQSTKNADTNGAEAPTLNFTLVQQAYRYVNVHC